MNNPKTPPAGWYPDPYDKQKERYWTGAAWTSQTRPLPSQPPALTAHPEAKEQAPHQLAEEREVNNDPVNSSASSIPHNNTRSENFTGEKALQTDSSLQQNPIITKRVTSSPRSNYTIALIIVPLVLLSAVLALLVINSSSKDKIPASEWTTLFAEDEIRTALEECTSSNNPSGCTGAALAEWAETRSELLAETASSLEEGPCKQAAFKTAEKFAETASLAREIVSTSNISDLQSLAGKVEGLTALNDSGLIVKLKPICYEE